MLEFNFVECFLPADASTTLLSESGSAAAKQRPSQTRVERMERASIAFSARAKFVVGIVLTVVQCCADGQRATNKYPTAWVRGRALKFCGQIPPAPPRTRGTVQYLCDNDRVCGGFGDRLRGMTQLWIDAMDEGADFEALMVRETVDGRDACATPRRPRTLRLIIVNSLVSLFRCICPSQWLCGQQLQIMVTTRLILTCSQHAFVH